MTRQERITKIKQDIKDLGIVYIDTFNDDSTLEDIETAIQAVKEADLNFPELRKRMEKERKRLL